MKKDVAAVMAAHKKNEDRISKLAQAINENAEKIAKIQISEEVLSALQRRIEDLDAEAAIGVDVANEKRGLVAKIKEAATKTEGAGQARALQVSLERSLASAMQDSNAHKHELDKLKLEYLKGEAEAAGIEYLAAATKTAKLFRRIMALDSMLGAMGHPVSIGTGQAERPIFPAFRLESLDQAMTSNLRNLLDVGLAVGHENYEPSGLAAADVREELDRMQVAAGFDEI